jgi:hypothetical protein
MGHAAKRKGRYLSLNDLVVAGCPHLKCLRHGYWGSLLKVDDPFPGAIGLLDPCDPVLERWVAGVFLATRCREAAYLDVPLPRINPKEAPEQRRRRLPLRQLGT